MKCEHVDPDDIDGDPISDDYDEDDDGGGELVVVCLVWTDSPLFEAKSRH